MGSEKTKRKVFLTGLSLLSLALINLALALLPKPCWLTSLIFNLGGIGVSAVLLTYSYFLIKFSKEEWPPSPEELNKRYEKELKELMEYIEKEAPELLEGRQKESSP